MSSILKKLAGQTALYGVSSILGRLLNYLLVPIHTTIFASAQLGVVTNLYAYVAFMNVLYTYGMETAFFRFNKQLGPKAYHTAAGALLVSSTLFSGLLLLLSQPVATALGYADQQHIIIWLAVIIWIDGIVAIPFAQLRHLNKAKRFVVFRMAAIVGIVLLNVVFLLFFPAAAKGTYGTALQSLVQPLYNEQLGVGYIFLANLIGNSVLVLCFARQLLGIRLGQIEWGQLKTMLVYALPILLTGLAGMVNENIDKLLFTALLPANFYEGHTPISALGVYGSTAKLGVFMLLAIQAFRYAGEPFFFAQAENKQAPALFAKVLRYFYLSGMVLFVGVSLNVELIAQLFLRQAVFREALYIVPLLLYAKLLFGVYINISIWYKLQNKTIYGTYITLAGAAITLVANVGLVPLFGYTGAAVAGILCFAAMVWLCYHYGQKYFPVPYRWLPLAGHTLVAVGVVAVMYQVTLPNFWANVALQLLVTAIYLLSVFLYEKKKLNARSQ